MAPVGRPRTRIQRTGSAPPTSQQGTPEIGVGGVSSWDGLTGGPQPWHMFIDQYEHVPEMRWPQSVQWYDQMRTDSQLAALYTSVVYGIQKLRYMIDPNGARPSLVQEISEDLNLPIKGKDGEPLRRMKRRFSHRSHVGQAFLALLYGYMYFEQNGDIVDDKFRLRKLVPLMPQSIRNINVAEDGGLVSVSQWNKNSGTYGYLPNDLAVDRLAAFIFQQEGANWVGRSMFRDCYRDWLIKDRLLRVEANNHEKAGGIPYVEAPMGATPGEIEELNQMMQAFRSGPVAGGAVPYGSKVNIARGDGSNINNTIKRYDEAMARRFMLMLANLAQGGSHVGSYALGETFEDFFLVGQINIAQWYCDVMNEHVIEDIADWNYGEDEELVPRLTWERTSEDSLGVDQLATLVQRGVIIVDDELENSIRFKYQMPKRTKPRPEVVSPGGPKQPTEQQTVKNPELVSPEPQKIEPAPAPAPTTASAGTRLGGAPSEQRVPAPFDWEQDDIVYGTPTMAKAATAPVLVTVPNVPILEAGVEYGLSTGPTTFTPEDLADAVTAANEDPSIPTPRLKIGHIDPRYNDPSTFDGTPSFGKATNLRLSDNGMIVYADYVGVPKWLADIIPTAYPSRSIECFWNIESNAGKTWRCVLTACSLLGVSWPGVMQLEDLPDYYGEEIPEGVVIVETAATGGDPMTTHASANLDDIRRAFYNEYIDEHKGEGSLWWWIRAVMTDPNQLVIEDDETGQLYLLPFNSDTEGSVSFGDPEAVRVDYIPDKKAAAAKLADALASGRKVMATYDSRASSRPLEGGQMDPAEVRQRLNLPEDASDEQVQEALAELNAAAGGTPPEQQGGTVTEPAPMPATGRPEPAAPGEEPQPSPEPHVREQQIAAQRAGGGGESGGGSSASAPNGNSDVVQLDRAAYEELQRGSQAGLRLEQQFRQTDIENTVASAIGDGRIPPSRRDHWVTLLQADLEGAKATLAGLEPGLIPVEQRGVATPAEGHAEADEQTVGEWTNSLFPETRARRVAEQSAAAAAQETGLPPRRPLIQTDRGV